MGRQVYRVLNETRTVKAVHITPKLHNGHLTIRVFMVPQTAEDPDTFIFTAEELEG